MKARRRLAGPVLAGLAAALALPAAAVGQAPAIDCATRSGAYDIGANCRVIDVDGHPRRFIAYVPATRPTSGSRAPVVLMFHGSSGDGEQFLRISGWREQADATGLVAVFPTGLRYRMLDSGRRITKWNDGKMEREIDLADRPPGYPDDAPFPADDVGFVDAVLGDLQQQLPVDRRRIFASGFSNGANFAARLAVQRSTVVAAAGFSAGGLQVEQIPHRPIPMSITLGTRDPGVLETTGLAELPLEPDLILTEPTISAALGVHLGALGLDPRFYGALVRPRRTDLRWPPSGAGPGGAALRFTMLAGVEHEFPNGTNNPAGFAVAPEFWEFFMAHPLP